MRRRPLLPLGPLVFALALTSADRIDARSLSGVPAAPAVSVDQHAEHGQEKPAQTPEPGAPDATPERHDQHDHVPASGGDPAQGNLPPFIPRLTDDDRKAAFPDVEGHAVHDQAVHAFVLLDQLEWQAGKKGSGVNLDSKGWIGRDRDRLWFRAEADSDQGRVGEAQAHILYGRQFSRWWDIVAGVRQDVRPGPAQTWAAIGVQGLAPYWFEVEATAYVGASGRTHVRVEVEYELLLTNRLILQPLLEAEIFGRSDPERQVGAGLSTTEAGFRLRYEFRRELAPYIGVAWSTKWGKTADLVEAGERNGGARFAAGARMWF